MKIESGAGYTKCKIILRRDGQFSPKIDKIWLEDVTLPWHGTCLKSWQESE
jgi:hypothetical protein